MDLYPPLLVWQHPILSRFLGLRGYSGSVRQEDMAVSFWCFPFPFSNFFFFFFFFLFAFRQRFDFLHYDDDLRPVTTRRHLDNGRFGSFTTDDFLLWNLPNPTHCFCGALDAWPIPDFLFTNFSAYKGTRSRPLGLFSSLHFSLKTSWVVQNQPDTEGNPHLPEATPGIGTAGEINRTMSGSGWAGRAGT